MQQTDVVILGAGAAGMMCAIEAGRRGRSVLLVEHNKAPGEKIRISGGGRCNFTNLHAAPKNFLSQNPHFCISALSRFSQHDFIARVEAAGIAYHEKTLGQLFCDGSAKEIIEMLLTDMRAAGVELKLETRALEVSYRDGAYILRLEQSGREFEVQSSALVVATGGKSIPKMGASGFGYRLAAQFDVPVVETRPGLVPLTFDSGQLALFQPLSGLGVDVIVSNERASFKEAMLFTHRGLSGPAILQISSYWREGEAVQLNLLPGRDAAALLAEAQQQGGGRQLRTALGELVPKRLAEMIEQQAGVAGKLAELSSAEMERAAGLMAAMQVKPVGSEGYRTAEVTLGGVDTKALSSKSMEVSAQPGLYFIGEVVDVTGWLGGYNFQWAWSTGYAAGQVV